MALEDHICEECSHWDDINGCWLDQPNGGALSPSQNMACPEFDGDDTDWDDDDDWQYDDRDDDPDDDWSVDCGPYDMDPYEDATPRLLRLWWRLKYLPLNTWRRIKLWWALRNDDIPF